jgi:hypothetical protein
LKPLEAKSTASRTKQQRSFPGISNDVGKKGAITIKDKKAFDAAFNLQAGDTFKDSGHCITQVALLAGTRPLESGDPDRSHKANCLKALRALDPGVFAEAVVQ